MSGYRILKPVCLAGSRRRIGEVIPREAVAALRAGALIRMGIIAPIRNTESEIRAETIPEKDPEAEAEKPGKRTKGKGKADGVHVQPGQGD